jgi:hypothetical protein
MSDFQDDEDPGRFVKRRGTPTGRVYVHTRCGGQTEVSGGDYTHICDPFWPCTGTYCCQCAGFAPLSEVKWVDTGESVAKYRSRLRAETPGLVKAWRYGLGFLAGGAVGCLCGLLVALFAQAPEKRMGVFALVGGLIGAVVCYSLGALILNRVYDIDYRRMR